MAEDFYPFVDNGSTHNEGALVPRHPARIAVYDDASAAPRVVEVAPQDVRSYLEEITLQVTQLAQAQGGTIPFMVVREIVENLIHAYFIEPTVSILDHGNTIRFSDQGPGIKQKELALQYGTSSATEEMRRYIRGVGSGLPYVRQYMQDKGGSLRIEDNLAGGTVVTISSSPAPGSPSTSGAAAYATAGQPAAGTTQLAQPWPAQGQPTQGGYAYGMAPQPSQQPWPQGAVQAEGQGLWPPQTPQGWPQQSQWSQQPWPQSQQYPQAQPWQQPQQPWPQATLASQMPQAAPADAAQRTPYAASPDGATTSPGMDAALVDISARGQQILDYLALHEDVGPSDLARAIGGSQPTWTRELQTLENQGLVRKVGQKRRLTAMGRVFLGSRQNG